jgi:hypothetical protein
MRLFEVAGRFTDDLETLLRNQLKSGRPSTPTEPFDKEAVKLSYPALSQLLNNMGYGNINFDQFAKIYDENPQLAPLIADYNQEFIILGKGDEEVPNTDVDIGDGPSVDQMASQGAAAHMKKIS